MRRIRKDALKADDKGQYKRYLWLIEYSARRWAKRFKTWKHFLAARRLFLRQLRKDRREYIERRYSVPV